MTAGVILREYRAADLGAVFALDQVCFQPVFRFSRRAMRGFAEARGAIARVAVRGDGELAGFVIVQVEREVGYVVTLDVAPAWRRGGVAGALLREAEGLAEAAGVREMRLHVYVGNAGAVRFYEGLGYGRVGVAVGFYGVGVDGLVYGKRLVG